MKTPKVRGRFDRLRRSVLLAIPPKNALTQQQFKDECDMNRIVRNAQRGIPPRYLAQGVPQYGDFDVNVDLTAAYNTVARAEEAFSSLPSALRAELGNDPMRFTEITEEQARRFKLIRETPQEIPVPDSAGQAVSGGTEPPSSTKKVNKD